LFICDWIALLERGVNDYPWIRKRARSLRTDYEDDDDDEEKGT